MIIVDSLIAVAPIISYYSQYSLIKQSKSVGSFSIDVCGILIIANIMRIFFWFASGFAVNLLFQSIFVIAIQFMILDICVKFGYKSKEEQQIQYKFNFWRWDRIEGFIMFSVILSVVLAVLTIIFTYLNIQLYGTILGLLSLSIEATLGFPQLISNQKRRSVEGLSIFMIGTWFMGDFLKTLYFVAKSQPFQFFLCGSFQIFIDSLIIIQIMAFSDKIQGYKGLKGQFQIQNSIRPNQINK